LEGGAVEVDEGFFDDRFCFSMTTFHVHHHGDGDAAGKMFPSDINSSLRKAK
jgi:hypothetical protein